LITIIDYGSGNISAISNIYERLNIPYKIAKTPSDIVGAEKLFLPGVGAFDETLPAVLQKSATIDFVFIDGNHRKDPTIAYFLAFLEKRTNDTLIIFDDIHWSAGMEEAWAYIVAHPAVTLSIDLFFIGIVWVNPSFLVKQHFSVRF
jgi:predicted O-methyltransferase YrrM